MAALAQAGAFLLAVRPRLTPRPSRAAVQVADRLRAASQQAEAMLADPEPAEQGREASDLAASAREVSL